MIKFLGKLISPGPIQGLTMSCRQDLEEIKFKFFQNKRLPSIMHRFCMNNLSETKENHLRKNFVAVKTFQKKSTLISLNFPSLWSILFKESTTSEAVWTLHPFKSPGQLGFCKSNGPLLNAHQRFS